MKWLRKGHEYDELARIVASNCPFYIWGAGVAGKAFFHNLEENDRSRVLGFLDNSVGKQRKGFLDKAVLSPAEGIETGKWIVIATLDFVSEIEDTLRASGKEENKDFMYSHIFLGILKLYKNHQVYMHHLNLPVTGYCTYRCKDCSLFIPYNEKPQHYPLEQLRQDVDLFFKWVDFVQELHLIGGEPLLYPELEQLALYIGSKYRERIGEFAIATNGTIDPKTGLLNVCKKCDVFFAISDYGVSNAFHKETGLSHLVNMLDAHSIDYRIGEKRLWLDFGNPSQLLHKEESLEKHFSSCFFRNHAIYEKKLYYCHHQLGGIWAKKCEEDAHGYFLMDERISLERKTELFEFSSGYNDVGYLDFCRHCYGFERVNQRMIPAAEQLK